MYRYILIAVVSLTMAVPAMAQGPAAIAAIGGNMSGNAAPAATPTTPTPKSASAEILGLINSLEEKMDSIENRVDNVTTVVGELETGLKTGLEEQKAQIVAITALREQQLAMNDQVADLQAQATEALATADRQAQQIAGLNGQVSQLQGQAQQLHATAQEARQQAAANYQMAQQASQQAQQAYAQAAAASRAAAPKGPIGKLLNIFPRLRHQGLR